MPKTLWTMVWSHREQRVDGVLDGAVGPLVCVLQVSKSAMRRWYLSTDSLAGSMPNRMGCSRVPLRSKLYRKKDGNAEQ